MRIRKQRANDMTRQQSYKNAVILATTSLSLLWLTGCYMGKNNPAIPLSDGTSSSGRIMGGQQPVVNTSVQLYESSASGYGSASSPIGSAVTTAADGSFVIPDFTCDTDRVLYVVGTGGQPIAATQSTSAVTNNNLALMEILGVCGGNTISFLNVNELTTVASIWALQPFMTDATHVGTKSTNIAGIADAVEVAYELVDPLAGIIPSSYTPAGATLPASEINTLADMLEQCVNSEGGSHGDSSNCGNLFDLSPDGAGTTYPTNTITAALNIAKNPGRNVAALNLVRSTSPVFQPVLDVNSPPNAWTIAITYTGGGLSNPSAIAVDGGGNVWVTNKGNNTVTKLDPTGSAVSSSSGFAPAGLSSPSSVAVDQSGYIWVTNSGNSSLMQLNSDGTAKKTVSALSGANSVSIDGNGSTVLSNGSSVMTVSSNGTVQNTHSASSTVVAVVSATK